MSTAKELAELSVRKTTPEEFELTDLESVLLYAAKHGKTELHWNNDLNPFYVYGLRLRGFIVTDNHGVLESKYTISWKHFM